MASLGKVLIIVENLPLPFDRRVWQESNSLKDAGYDVTVICPKGKEYQSNYEFINGIHVYRHPIFTEANSVFGYVLEYGSALIWEFVLAWKVLFRYGFDVIHACNPPDTMFLVGLFFKIFLGKKFLFDHHDINPELYIAKFGRRDFFYRMMLFLERCTFWSADISIATNESYRAIALERGKMDPSRVFVVRSGPDLARMKLLSPRIELKHGRKFLVGYVGVMGKQEGIDLLLRSVKHIISEMKFQDIHFGLVGGGTELESLKQYALELGISDHVTFTGRVPDMEMLEMLSTADICVNPDIVNEMNDKSTMNKIMEYMALAKPIVQFELTEGRVTADQASLYAKANDERDLALKIITLLNNEPLRKKMGEFGRQRVISELSWEHESPKLLSAYRKLFS